MENCLIVDSLNAVIVKKYLWHNSIFQMKNIAKKAAEKHIKMVAFRIQRTRN